MKGTRQKATGGRGEVEARFLLLTLILCLFPFLRLFDQVPDQVLEHQLEHLEDRNEDQQSELPSPTKTHLNLTCMKPCRLRRWASSHG